MYIFGILFVDVARKEVAYVHYKVLLLRSFGVNEYSVKCVLLSSVCI